MSSQTPDIHFLIVPLMSQSHLIPMIDFAKILAKRGFIVTVITTPLNSARFEPMVEQSIKIGHKIKLTPLRFPCQEAGLPEGCENFDTVTSPELKKAFFEASEMLHGPVEKLISETKPSVNCVISSMAVPWATEIARKFDLPVYLFNTVSCFTMLLWHNMCSTEAANTNMGTNIDTDKDTVVIPNMPHKVEFAKTQLHESARKNRIKDFIEKMKKGEQLANGNLINSFEEIEHSYVDDYKNIKKKTWCIGPVSLYDNEMCDKFNRGSKASVDPHMCLDWLDSRKPSSVVYACFGSLCHLPFIQLIEIGLGLESSSYDFIWIIRKCDNSEKFDKWMKDEKFEERNRLKGLVIRGWAPQAMILSHPSTGGFITHCGWNSTLECISEGVPMITWPMFAEQFNNEKLVTQVLGIGVRIGVETVMEWGEENLELIVKRENVKKAIELLMSEGEEGNERRRKAKVLSEKAKRSVKEGGSSYSNISSLIEDVIQNINQNNSSDKEGFNILINVDGQNSSLENLSEK